MHNWRFWWIVLYCGLLLSVYLIARHIGRMDAEIIMLKAEVSALYKFVVETKQ